MRGTPASGGGEREGKGATTGESGLCIDCHDDSFAPGLTDEIDGGLPLSHADEEVILGGDSRQQ